MVLRFHEELSLEEIANVVRAPLSTIKSRLYRGMAMIKQQAGLRGLRASRRRCEFNRRQPRKHGFALDCRRRRPRSARGALRKTGRRERAVAEKTRRVVIGFAGRDAGPESKAVGTPAPLPWHRLCYCCLPWVLLFWASRRRPHRRRAHRRHCHPGQPLGLRPLAR